MVTPWMPTTKPAVVIRATSAEIQLLCRRRPMASADALLAITTSAAAALPSYKIRKQFQLRKIHTKRKTQTRATKRV